MADAQAPARRRPGTASRSVFKSQFGVPETPPSHGFRGLAAIKAVAESGEGCGARLAAGNQPTGRLRLLCCGLKSIRKWIADASKNSARIRQFQPSLRAFHSFFESEFKAPKTPPSHGFSGFVAIKTGAESGERLRDAAGSGKTAYGQFAAALLPPEIRSEVACGRNAKLASLRPNPALPCPSPNHSQKPIPTSPSSPVFAPSTLF